MEINIGDIVEVIPQEGKSWTFDWMGVPLRVVGINAKRRSGEYDGTDLDYTVVPVEHPKDGGTDGFADEDLRVVTVVPQPPAQAVAVEVKKLIWHRLRHPTKCGGMHVRTGTYKSRKYRIIEYEAQKERKFMAEYRGEPIAFCETITDAVAAVDAHHADFILSAINARPEAIVKAEALREIVGLIQEDADGGTTRYAFNDGYGAGIKHAVDVVGAEADRLDQKGNA